MKNALVIITVAFLFCSVLVAQDTVINRRTLKGLTGVNVAVESEQPGVEKDHIRTDVELRLRMAGIKVLTDEEWLAAPGMPTLYVILNVLKRRDSSCAVSLRIELCQIVRLKREPQITLPAATWQGSELIGSVGLADLSSIRNQIKDEADKFINAWLSVNPK